LFVAVPLPQNVAAALAALEPRPAEGVRPVPLPDLHITLHFLGAVEAAPAQQALARVGGPIFEIRLGRLGHFRLGGDRRILWAGVKSSESLSALHARVATALAPTGFTPERRAYRPHVTLARVARPASRAVIEAFERGRVPAAASAFRCERFALYLSRTDSTGARYTELQSYPLG
jgi:2'-5' RNA ligase